MSRRPVVQDGDACMAQQHGTPSAFDWWGCRCPGAREAYRLYRKRRETNRLPSPFVPSLGTARRLRSLVAAGHSWKQLSAELGLSLTWTRRLALDEDGTIRRTTAERVEALFTRLALVPGDSPHAFTVARKNGWAPPLAWDDIDDPEAEPCLGEEKDDLVDEVAVERVLAGEHLELTDAELIATLQAGTARGESLSALSLRLGINYTGAKKLLAGELTPRRAKRARRAAS